MKALYYEKKLAFRDDLPKPTPKNGDALVKVVKSGICRTDIEIAKGYMDFTGIPGHEFVGIVEDASDKSLIGDRVVGEINCGCGECYDCKSGNHHHCNSRTVLGIKNHNGSFAEYLTIPEKNLHHIPEALSDDEAMFVEPLAAAFRVAEQVVVMNTDSLVLGDGKLGILIAQIIAFLKGDVTLCGKYPEKMKLVDGKNIATLTLDELKEKRLYSIVVDATGNPDGIKTALAHTKPRGTLILKTTIAANEPPQIGPAELNHIVINEITVKGSRCGPFVHAITLLEQQLIAVTPLIEKTFPLEKGLEAFEAAKRPGALKILIGN
ncbi:MAG: alcohol dehydrogenase catalytic domain-containing protein [Nitrospinota bacterium]|nr:alcohol dehydrogenase catalytic domain-containing protein [Nitrospinota bacterium]